MALSPTPEPEPGPRGAALVVRCRFLPRDVRDAFVAVVALALSIAAVYLVAYLPLLILADVVAATIGAAIVAVAVATRLALIAIHRLTLDDDGIALHRPVGGPRFVPWEKVTGIRRAERADVVLRSWMLPGWPPNGAALSLTSSGHYRIDWEGGRCFFPPSDEAGFLGFVERKWGGLL